MKGNNLKITWTFFCLFFFACSATKDFKQEITQEIRKKVFFFAGQSNMDGRANGAQLSELDLNRLKKVAHRIQFFYNHQPVTPLQLTTPSNYIQKKFSLEKSFGPELFFGIELAEKHPDEEFIFIKRAKGGTSLYGCWNPYWDAGKAKQMNELNAPKLFSDFVNYSKEVLAKYKTTDYEIVGMLWVQGEADSGEKRWGKEPAETYGENLRILIKEVRKIFKINELPFVIFQVGNGKVVEGMKTNAANDENVFLIPQSKIKNSPNFYERNPPPIGHYTAKSMKQIGERFFEVFDENYSSKFFKNQNIRK